LHYFFRAAIVTGIAWSAKFSSVEIPGRHISRLPNIGRIILQLRRASGCHQLAGYRTRPGQSPGRKMFL
jgi:hypothetical protein